MKAIERALKMLNDCDEFKCHPNGCKDCHDEFADDARKELKKLLEATHGLISAIEMENECSISNAVDELREVLEGDH